ncbi:alanine dehydrogenase [Parerythrobacter jejuensis]|uniref:Alanine dehydrogenase n=1 Tax=Parerythrobacter jejuensis TaxID=795812 RepID=A0A845AWK6_9SPHN|nr:alanine dehydrogenase [Parerythrobacter jejuensis]MXP31169.1 alanine dehydrogenase [Parerythrobacter jejuensis]MXP33929.1 alanine dehydrogenase [Parerythrobacter jejuensis]
MRIGCPKEIKNHEYRVGLTPESARELVGRGNEVWMETGAGLGIGATDAEYISAGAKIVDGPDPIFAECEMVVKVKEPQAVERAKLRRDQILYTYLHLAPDPDQTRELVDSGVTAIAYETVTGPGGTLPLLKPMSQVAGRMSIQAGATALEKAHGGRGVLLGGVPGVLPGKVVVIGGGVVGFNAAQMAVGLGGDVEILDRDPEVLEKVGTFFESRASTRFSNKTNLEDAVRQADLVIGAVLIPGAAAPKLITRALLKEMKPGAVLVDVAIDQGGCFETSKATTHAEPTYVVDDIVHYCVANMPGAVARTSTYALNNVTLPHALQIAKHGWKGALSANPHLAEGLNVHDGAVTYEAVASELGYDYTPVADVLA